MITIKQTVKSLTLGCVLVCAMLLGASAASAVTTVADSWAASDMAPGVGVVANGGSIAISLPADFGNAKAATLTPFASTGELVGDYTRAGATSLAVTVAGNAALPEKSSLMLSASGGRLWLRRNLLLGENLVSLNRTVGPWVLAYADTADPAVLDGYWAADLKDVTDISVRVHRNTAVTGTHNVTLSAFSLSSTRDVGAVLDELESALAAAFNGKTSLDQLTEAEMLQDSDDDGMTDVNEILAELNPCDQQGVFATTLFAVSVTAVGDGEAEIEFACVAGQAYTIYASDTVGGSVTLVGTSEPSETGYDSITDVNAGSGPRFYTVVQNCQ